VADLSHSTTQNFHHVDIVVERLVYEIKRLEDELRHSRERAADAHAREADARERLRLEIETRLLSENRQLPPATENPKTDDAE